MQIIPLVVATILQSVTASDSSSVARDPLRQLQTQGVPPESSFDGTKIEFDIPGVAYDTPPSYFNAQDVSDNTNENNVLIDFVTGFGDMSNVIFQEMFGGDAKKRSLLLPTLGGGGVRRNNRNRKLQALLPVEMTDIACPATLLYTPPTGGECVNFHVVVDTGDMSSEDVETFKGFATTAIADGFLYDFVTTENPDTNIRGLGDPGKGVGSETEDDTDSNEPVETPKDEDTEEPEDDVDKVPPADKESIEFDIPGSAWDTAAYGHSSLYDTYNAAAVMDNNDDNDILSQFVDGFGKLSNEIFSEMPIGEERKIHLPLRRLQTLEPIFVTDIPCPETTYAPPSGVECLNFKVVITTGDMSAADVSSFEDLMTEAIAEGRLYDTIVADYPDTNISGLGEPGNGYDYKENADEDSETTDTSTTPTEISTTSAATTTAEQTDPTEMITTSDATTTEATTTEATTTAEDEKTEPTEPAVSTTLPADIDIDGGEGELGPVIPDVDGSMPLQTKSSKAFIAKAAKVVKAESAAKGLSATSSAKSHKMIDAKAVKDPVSTDKQPLKKISSKALGKAGKEASDKSASTKGETEAKAGKDSSKAEKSSGLSMPPKMSSAKSSNKTKTTKEAPTDVTPSGSTVSDVKASTKGSKAVHSMPVTAAKSSKVKEEGAAEVTGAKTKKVSSSDAALSKSSKKGEMSMMHNKGSSAKSDKKQTDTELGKSKSSKSEESHEITEVDAKAKKVDAKAKKTDISTEKKESKSSKLAKTEEMSMAKTSKTIAKSEKKISSTKMST